MPKKVIALTPHQLELIEIANLHKKSLLFQNISPIRVRAWHAGALYRITENEWACCQCGQNTISLERFRNNPFLATCNDNCQQNLDNQRNLLIIKRDQHYNDLQVIENSIRATVSDRLNSICNHPAEQNSVPRNDLTHRQKSTTKLIEHFDKAIDMCDYGTYGICSVCHEKIDPRRLAVTPSTDKCVICKHELEAQNELPNGFGGRTPRSRIPEHSTVM